MFIFFAAASVIICFKFLLEIENFYDHTEGKMIELGNEFENSRIRKSDKSNLSF